MINMRHIKKCEVPTLLVRRPRPDPRAHGRPCSTWAQVFRNNAVWSETYSVIQPMDADAEPGRNDARIHYALTSSLAEARGNQIHTPSVLSCAGSGGPSETSSPTVGQVLSKKMPKP